jgi:hypothetical protein
MSDFSLPTSQQISEFHERGCLLLRGFYDLDLDVKPIQTSIHDIIGQVMKRHGLSDTRHIGSYTEFDDGYLDLIARNRAWGGEVYDAVKQIPAFGRLVSSPKNERLFRVLRPHSVPGLAAGGYGIRIDNPREERFRAPWHQEYPAQLRSLDGIVFWTPLVPIDTELGPVEGPGSSQSAVPVYTRPSPDRGACAPRKGERYTQQISRIAPLTALARCCYL